MIKDYSCLINEKIIKFETYFSDLYSLHSANQDIEKLINKPFTPSKTAQNSLNFITKEDESHLSKENLPHSEEISNILKIVYILIKQNYERIEESSLASNLINKILVNMKVENLSNIIKVNKIFNI